VFLEDGQLIHAVYRELDGEPALRMILAMPAGSLRTMVLPQTTPHSITRDFQTLLLDSLRTVDEDNLRELEDELADLDDVIPAEPALNMQHMIERLRRLDGYAASLTVDVESGVVLGGDGAVAGMDLPTAAIGYGELYRIERELVAKLGDHIVDVVITLSSHYHVLHAITGHPSLLLCVVLDRNASLGLARYAIASVGALSDGGIHG
jgi:hypothetical protein